VLLPGGLNARTTTGSSPRADANSNTLSTSASRSPAAMPWKRDGRQAAQVRVGEGAHGRHPVGGDPIVDELQQPCSPAMSRLRSPPRGSRQLLAYASGPPGPRIAPVSGPVGARRTWQVIAHLLELLAQGRPRRPDSSARQLSPGRGRAPPCRGSSGRDPQPDRRLARPRPRRRSGGRSRPARASSRRSPATGTCRRRPCGTS
jgi:hypothetical protein